MASENDEVILTGTQVLSGVAKWCWGRLQGGVVGWDAYELFKIGEGGEYFPQLDT